MNSASASMLRRLTLSNSRNRQLGHISSIHGLNPSRGSLTLSSRSRCIASQLTRSHLRFNSSSTSTSTSSLSNEPSESPLEETPTKDAAAEQSPPSPSTKTGFLYFDSTFPIKLGWWDPRQSIAKFTFAGDNLLEMIKSSIPEGEIGHGFKILGLDAR